MTAGKGPEPAGRRRMPRTVTGSPLPSSRPVKPAPLGLALSKLSTLTVLQAARTPQTATAPSRSPLASSLTVLDPLRQDVSRRT